MSIDATQTGSGWTVEPIPPTGAGFTKNATTGMAETDVGGETFVALPKGTNGEARGIYVGRTGTLASLIGQTESANENEIAVATDQPALVRYGLAESANYVFTPEIAIDVGNITYGGAADGIGWFLSEGFPNFRLPAGVRRIVLTSSRVDKGLHPDLQSTGASTGTISFQVPLAEYQRCPRYEIIIAAKLDVGGCTYIFFSNDGGDGAAVQRINVSSTAYWPPVIECVVGPNLSTNNNSDALLLRPASVSAVTAGQAHVFVAA